MTQPEKDDLPSIDAFGAKLEKLRKNDSIEETVRSTESTELGKGLRIGAELLAAFLIGGAIGMGADSLFGSKPWGLLVGLGFGFAAGLLNVLRAIKEMDAVLAPTKGHEPE